MINFENRTEAGKQLAEKLANQEWRHSCVLALPRGGVPVAIEVAHRLGLPWDVLIVKKIGSPMQPEYAIGAIAEEDRPVWNEEALTLMDLTAKDRAVLVYPLREKIRQRIKAWRPQGPKFDVEGKIVILVDDGLATGLTMRAAVEHLKRRHAKKIIVAVPVAPESVVTMFEGLVDQLVVLKVPPYFSAVGEWYDDFTQVDDETVTGLLKVEESFMAPHKDIDIATPQGSIKGILSQPPESKGLIIFAHGSGSSRLSPRNQLVAHALNKAGFTTLLFDLLTLEEAENRADVFDIDLLSGRLALATQWARKEPELSYLNIAYYGASTGAAAALVAASKDPQIVTVVSRGGRPDLARDHLKHVSCPVLLVVGGEDTEVLSLNREAKLKLREASLLVIPGATHLFEEAGTLENVIKGSTDWFKRTFNKPKMAKLSNQKPSPSQQRDVMAKANHL